MPHRNKESTHNRLIKEDTGGKNVFGIGVPELMLILVLALIVLGPDKLPQLAKQIARFVGELKKASEDFKKQLDIEGLEDIRELKEMADLKNPQQWRKNFDRLMDIDTASGTVGPAGTGDIPKTDPGSDLIGGLGPEWKVAKGGGHPSADTATDVDSEREPPLDDVINPTIDPEVIEAIDSEQPAEKTEQHAEEETAPQDTDSRKEK